MHVAGLKGSDAGARQKTHKLVATSRQLDAMLRILSALSCRPEWATTAAAPSTASSAGHRASAGGNGVTTSQRRPSMAMPPPPTPGMSTLQ